MSFLNNPLLVETMLDEKKMKPRDIEMAQLYEEVRALNAEHPVRTPGLLARLHGFLVATVQRPPRAKKAVD